MVTGIVEMVQPDKAMASSRRMAVDEVRPHHDVKRSEVGGDLEQGDEVSFEVHIGRAACAQSTSAGFEFDR